LAATYHISRYFPWWHCCLVLRYRAGHCEPVLGLAGAQYWFVSPHSLRITNTGQALGIFLFLFVCASVIFMGETRSRENRKLRSAKESWKSASSSGQRNSMQPIEDLRDLTARLLQSQDDERRRIARELHTA